MTKDIKKFYADLTPLYHLVYPDWDTSIERQAAMLDGVIRENWGVKISSILDASCGIGTQALGLAKLGYEVTASDLSPDEVARAKVEAEKRSLSISFSVADMRQAFNHHACQFDLVISCDNSIPHLLTDDDILTALRSFYDCTRPGGGCLISVRDYENEDLTKRQVKPYGIRDENGTRYLIFQVWDPQGSAYDLTMYFVEDTGGPECRTHVIRSQYYPVGIAKLMELLNQAGFADVTRIDDKFFQPIMIGMRKA